MPEELITDLGNDLRSELQSGEYTGFFVMTYSIDADLLEWCSDEEGPMVEEVLLSAPEDRLGELDLTPYAPLNVRTEPNPTHAKIYLLWDDNRVVCWFGSGNFTSAGLSYNVEWTARYEATLSDGVTVSVDALRRGGLPPEPTSKRVVNQILDIVTARLQDRSADFADDVFTQRPPVSVLHTELGWANTLRQAVESIGKTADRLEVTYFTPFVNKTGVERFAELTGIPDDEFRLEVRTAEHERVLDGRGQYLRQRHVEALTDRFDSFELYRRKSGDDRAILADGTRIRDGFAHFKLVLLTTISDNTRTHHAIFTTANLTSAVWDQPADRLEVGIWLRPSGGAKDVHEFGDLLLPCYAEPDQEDYETIDIRLDEAEQGQGYADRSIGEILGDRLQIDADTLRFEWPDGYPPLTELSCTVQTRNVVTAEPDDYSVDLCDRGEKYIAELDEVAVPPNTVVNRVRFDVTTRLRPPIREVEPGELESALEADRNIDWDGALVGPELTSESLESLAAYSDRSLVLYREWESPRTYPIFHRTTEPTQLRPPLLTEVHSGVHTVPATDALLPTIRITHAESIDPPFDTVVFETPDGVRVSPLGYSRDDRQLRFYFGPTVAGDQLSVEFDSPYAAWDPERREIELPSVADELPEWLDSIRTEVWSHEPVLKTSGSDQWAAGVDGIDPTLFITETTSVRINAPTPPPSLPDSVTRRYGFARRGFGYHQPKTNPLSEPIPSQSPHATVEYWGEYRLEDGNSTIVLPTQRGRYKVRKQLAQRLLPRQTTLTRANSLPWDELDPLTPLGWLVVPNEQLAFETIPEPLHRHVSLEVYRNDQLLSTETVYATHQQAGYAVPITKQDCIKGVEFSFIARLDTEGSVEDEGRLYGPYTEVVNCSMTSNRGDILSFEFEIRSPQSGRRLRSQYSITEDPSATLPVFDVTPLTISSKGLTYEEDRGFLTDFNVSKTDAGIVVAPRDESRVMELQPSDRMH